MQNHKVQNLRALAIALVVLGHSIIIYSSHWNLYSCENECYLLDQLKNLINLIQMPVFFCISGYLFYGSCLHYKSIKDLLSDKTKRLILPYLIFAFLWVLPIRLLVAYPGYRNCSILKIIFVKLLAGFDNGHLWYLQTLFLIFIISYFIFNSNKSISIIILFVSFVIAYFSHLFKYSVIINIFLWLPWFLLGESLNNFSIPKIFSYNWFRIFCVSGTFFYVFVILKYSLFNDFIYSTVGSLLLLLTSYLIIPNQSYEILNKISKNSFGIYLIHSPLVYISFRFLPNVSPIIMILLNFCVWGGLSYFMTFLIKSLGLGVIIGDKKRRGNV